ncbi:MlaA lipoprotein [compost metagenome]
MPGCTNRTPGDATVDRAQVIHPAHDPAERVDGGMFAFDKGDDGFATAPFSHGYRQTPGYVGQGEYSFTSTFGEPAVFISYLSQNNGQRSTTFLGRFGVDTRWGVWGIGNGPVVEGPLLDWPGVPDGVGYALTPAFSPFANSSHTVKTLSAVTPPLPYNRQEAATDER